MDIHMQLLKKGVKAKKKRLGGSGGSGGGGSLIGTKLTASRAKAAPAVPINLATVDLTIEDIGTGLNYTDPTSGVMIRRRPVDDFVAISQGTSHFNTLTNGTAQLVANHPNGYAVIISGLIHVGMNSASNEILDLSIVQNTTGGTITLRVATDLIAYTQNGHRQATVVAEFDTNCGAGDIILKASVRGGGTDTDSNVIAGTAQISDAYYLKCVFS